MATDLGVVVVRRGHSVMASVLDLVVGWVDSPPPSSASQVGWVSACYIGDAGDLTHLPACSTTATDQWLHRPQYRGQVGSLSDL